MIRSQASFRPGLLRCGLGERLDRGRVIHHESRIDQVVLDELLVELDHYFRRFPFRLQLDIVGRRRYLRSVSAGVSTVTSSPTASETRSRIEACRHSPSRSISEPSRAGTTVRPDRPGRVDDERLGQLHHRELVAVGLVGLEHRELRRVGGVEALVAEGAADLVDLLDAADHRPLEVELERDPQQHVLVEGVQVGAERPGRGTAVGQLEDRGLDLDVAALVEGLAQAAQHGGLGAHHLARLGPDHHVDVAQPDAGLVGERPVLVGQRAQRLGRQLPLGGLRRDSSPRRLVITSPRTARRSPMSTSALNSASDSSPTSARLSITWISEPSPSRSRAKQSLPVLRWKITRPVIATCSPVWVSGSSSPASSGRRTSRGSAGSCGCARR